METIHDLNIGWDNFQDLKLILYSINFYGKESIPFSALEKCKFKASLTSLEIPELVTNNFTKSDLDTIFEILQDYQGQVSKNDLTYFIREAELNI